MIIKYKVKYGQEGLFLDLYHVDNKLSRVILSKDYPKIFNFLGLSYERYLDGFNELEDIFEYISKSKFFNWKMFQMKQLNKINRDRNLKRKSYMSFLEWIDDNVADSEHEKNIDLTIFDFKYINNFFPEANLEVEIRRVEYEYCKSLYIKSKFNGGMVMREYGIEGSKLGEIMKAFKTFVEFESIEQDYDKFILNNDQKDLKLHFELFLTDTIRFGYRHD
jgi:hypothetical protein